MESRLYLGGEAIRTMGAILQTQCQDHYQQEANATHIGATTNPFTGDAVVLADDIVRK